VDVLRSLRWLLSGYDWPLHRDWLAWVRAIGTCTLIIMGLVRDPRWGVAFSVWAFPWCGWILGAVRAFTRGWRGQDHVRRPSGDVGG
jgi:hypothetical protein